MKKLMLVAVLLGSAAMTFAQTEPAKTVKTHKHAKTEMKAEAKKEEAKKTDAKAENSKMKAEKK